jgi:hypothetical protein
MSKVLIGNGFEVRLSLVSGLLTRRSMNFRRTVLAVPILALAVWLAPAPVDAASVKGVQSGTVTMTATPQVVSITAVDATKAFVVCTTRTDNSAPTNRATCELTGGGASVTITTGAVSANMVVQWYVVEFDGGVNVQRNSVNITATQGTSGAPVNVTIPTSVDTTKSFVLITERTAAAFTAVNLDEQWRFRARLTSGTNLELTRGSAPSGGNTITVAWQVVTIDDASVQRGTATLASFSTATSTLTPALTAVNTATSFLLFTHRVNATGGIEARQTVRGVLAGATTATFTRVNGTSTAIDIAWEVVTLNDGSAVTRNTTAVAIAAGSGTPAAQPSVSVNLSRSIAVLSTNAGTSTNTSDADDVAWTATLTATNLNLQRIGTFTTAGSGFWQVLSFFSCSSLGAVANVGYVSATAQDGQVTLNWSSANPALILRKQGAFGGSDAPAAGQVYTVGATVGTATVVFNGSGSSAADTGLTNGQTYDYRIFPQVASGNTPCYATGAGSDVNGRPVAAGGSEQWSYMLGGGSSLRAPLSDDSGNVYFASNSSRIVSLAGTTGLQSWAPASTTAAVQGYMVWTTLSASGAGVFGGDQSGRVYSIDPVTGAANTNWPVALVAPADAVQAGVTIQIRAYSDSAFTTAFPGTYDVVFAATANNTGAFTTNNKVVALRSDTGAVLWTFNPCSPGCAQNVDVILGQPWIDYQRNRLYVASRAGAAGTQQSLWVLNSLTGAVVTSFALGHLETAPTMSFDGNTLWVGNKNGDLYAVNLVPGTPALKWAAPLALGSSAFINGFVWEDFDQAERIYFTTANGALRCFEDPGVGATPNAATPCSGWSSATTAVSGPTTAILLDAIVYVGSWNGSTGRLVPISKLDGTAGTAFTVGDGTKQVGDMGSVTGGEIFIGTTEGKVFKISLPLP